MIKGFILNKVFKYRTITSVSKEEFALLKKHFDESFYFVLYPDVKESGVDAIYHYIAVGESENRSPIQGFSPSLYTEEFDGNRGYKSIFAQYLNSIESNKTINELNKLEDKEVNELEGKEVNNINHKIEFKIKKADDKPLHFSWFE